MSENQDPMAGYFTEHATFKAGDNVRFVGGYGLPYLQPGVVQLVIGHSATVLFAHFGQYTVPLNRIEHIGEPESEAQP